MNKICKRVLSFVLAALLVLGMVVTGAAAYDVESPEVTVENVQSGDIVKAYQLIKYADTNYNAYEFDGKFQEYVDARKVAAGYDASMSTEAYFETLKSADVASLLGDYATECGTNADIQLPASPVTATVATGENSVKLTLDPGYYLLLVTTTVENSLVYKPVSVFVQVKNGEVKIYAGKDNEDITKNPTIAMKSAGAPEITKEVLDNATATASWNHSAGAKVGETMKFSINLVIPAYQGVPTLTLELVDTLEALKYNEAVEAKVYRSRAGSNFTKEIEGAVIKTTVGDYDAETAKQTVKFELDYEKLKAAQNDVETNVFITYEATVTKDATADRQTTAETEDAVSPVINYAKNTAVLNYTTSLETADPDAAAEVKSTDPQSTFIYTYAIKLDKRSATEHENDDEEQPLKKLNGAEFTLYRDAAMTDAIQMIAEESFYRPATAEEIADTDTEKVTVLPADNTFLVKGLDVGVYYLKEIKVPTGYYAPKGGFKIDLNGERVNVTNALNGKLADSQFTAEADDDRTLVGTADRDELALNQLDITLKNSSTPILPTTGGMGTALFTVGGVALMAVAAWLFFFRRKDKKEN